MADKNNFKRRNLIKVVGATGIASMSMGAAAAQPRENVELEEPDGQKRNKILREALSDEEVKKIRREAVDNKFTPRKSNTKVGITRVDGEVHHRTVVIPFVDPRSQSENDNEHSDMFIYWTDLDVSEEEKNINRVAMIEPTDNESGTKLIITSVDNGTIATSEKEPFSDSISVQDTGDSCDSNSDCNNSCCNRLSCDSINWSCATYLAATYAGGLLVCGACVADPTQLSCTGCYLALTAERFGPDDPPCSIGTNCETVSECAGPGVQCYSA